MDAVKHFSPAFVGDLLDSMHLYGMNPSLVVGEWYSTNASELSGWVHNVKASMEPATLAAIQPKIFDFTLRENLRQACDDGGFDVRNIFNGSLRDASGLSGFNIVTFTNNHDFRDMTGFASLIHNNPNLAYAYILTNNQLGVPTIFYPDYYGYPAPAGGLYNYHPTTLPAYKAEIDVLIKVLQSYINGSAGIDYLNRFSTPYTSNFMEGSSNRALIYQLKGFAGNGNREILVAINFGNTALKVDHQINTRSGTILQGTHFTDILGRSSFPHAVLNTSNQVYIELPPASYSVWVQGDLFVLPLRLATFNAKAQNNAVLIDWKVSDNQEAKTFIVQRAVEGAAFKNIATVPAKNKDGEANYLFKDKKPVRNTLMLYRLKVINKSGKEAFCEHRLVRLF